MEHSNLPRILAHLGLRRAVFIGRYQPFHIGHEWMIRQKLDKGIPCLVMVRDCEDTTFNCAEVRAMIEDVFDGEDVDVLIIPDIESINYGRGVGYEINDHGECPIEVCGTAIRKFLPGWESYVHPAVERLLKIWGYVPGSPG